MSTTSTGRSSTGGSGMGRTCPIRPSNAPVVWGFLRHGDIVRMALAHPRRRDANERGAFQVLDGRCAAVAHRLANPADQLMEHGPERPLVAHPALDPLRYKLLDFVDV